MVRQRISELGEPKAAEFFEVSPALVRQWVRGTKPISLSAVEKVFSTDKLLADHGRVVEAQWEGKNVAILLPFYKQTNPLTTFSLMSILDRTKMGIMMQFGDAFVTHTRNKLADQFLKSGIEWSWWVDDDMICPCGKADWFNTVTEFNLPAEFAGLHTINQLLDAKQSIVSGLYFGRTKSRKPVFGGASLAGIETIAQNAPHRTVRQVPWVGFGCVLIHRQVYIDMQRQFPQLAPQMPGDSWHLFSNSEDSLVHATAAALEVLNDDNAGEDARVREARRIISAGIQTNADEVRLRMGEDVTFCRRAAKAGHPSHVDFSLVCGHVGTHVYGPKRTAIAT